MNRFLLAFVALSVLLFACREEEDCVELDPPPVQVPPSGPAPYVLDLPDNFVYINPPLLPEDNPLTVEGIALGRKLFFEKKLSRNNSFSCASCHKPSEAFNDQGAALSMGVSGQLGLRNAMPLFNLAFNREFQNHGAFNWLGSTNSLEQQALGPVSDPLEMEESWINVASKLQNDPNYPPLFVAAFGTAIIDSNLVTKALAQFERTLISGESVSDNEAKKRLGDPYDGRTFNAQERRGYEVYLSENRGDCAHCHGLFPDPLWTDRRFHNNGLEANPDSALATQTKLASDIGKFKTPSLRNLVYTAPYMHDGRFQTLEEVVDFYADNVQISPTVDPSMLKVRNMDAFDRADLVAFLKTITDSAFVQNPDFQEP